MNDVEFPLHTRIMLHSLQKLPDLNGKHGTISSTLDDSTGRYTVDLDVCTPDDQGRINVKPRNLTKEPPRTDVSRAGVERGILVERHGRAMNHLLDASQFIVGHFILEHPYVTSIDSIFELRDRQSIDNCKLLNKLFNLMWRFWDKDGEDWDMPRPVSNNRKITREGVYGLILDYVLVQIPLMLPPGDDQCRLMTEAVEKRYAVGGWDRRIHGEFWIIGQVEDRNGGTYVIPHKNHHVVYKVFGIRTSLYTLVQMQASQNQILKVTLTLLPWFGRLVYDGNISPGKNGNSVIIAKEDSCRRFRDSVDASVREGTVIESLRELELDVTTTSSAPPAQDQNGNDDTDMHM